MNINKLLQNKLVIVLIFIACGFVYFYKLSEIPNGFYVDESTVAYNAKSILSTGKDEYGFAFPIYFRLMGSYTPSLFIYLSAVAIKIFGYYPIVPRSLSAASAIISVYIFYLLLVRLKIVKKQSTRLIISIFFALSPWIVFNARVGYETTFGFMVFNAGAYLMYCALSSPKYYKWAMLFLSVSTYISHNQRFLAPLIIVAYLALFRKSIFKKENKKHIYEAFVVGLFTQIPNLLMITTPAFWIKNAQFEFKYINNFLMYLSPKTLFWQSPDIDMQHTIPKLSMGYDWMVFFYLIGIYLIARRVKLKNYKFIAMYFVVSLVPSVFSGYFHSSQRSLAFAVPLFIAIGVGVEEAVGRVNKKISIILLLLIFIYSGFSLYSSYFVLFPKERYEAWNYGYDQLANFISEHSNSEFLVDSTRNPRAYILLLYHMDISPKEYQMDVDSIYRDKYYKALPPALEYKFANVLVRPIDWAYDSTRDTYIIGDHLSVSSDQAVEHGLAKIKDFHDPFGNTIFSVFRTSKGI